MHSPNWAQITSIEWLHCDSSPESYSDWISIGTGRGSHTLCPKATEGTVCIVIVLICRTNSGFIVQKFVWNEAATSFPFNVNDPVEAQAYDNINVKLALASHSGVIKVFKLHRSRISYSSMFFSCTSDWCLSRKPDSSLGGQQYWYTSIVAILWFWQAIPFDIFPGRRRNVRILHYLYSNPDMVDNSVCYNGEDSTIEWRWLLLGGM